MRFIDEATVELTSLRRLFNQRAAIFCGVRQRFGKVGLAFKNWRPLDRKILVLREYRPWPQRRISNHVGVEGIQ